ncbi:MAG TPA: Ig-like domain repeat protein [Terracidiphilus sp.]|nr:Ig-like domain repeat protein [Terracidiphilus sp.]
MATESVAMFRSVARNVCLVLAAGLLSGSAAVAQLPIQAPAPVTAGSIIPFNHGATGLWSQVYSMKIAPNGSILFLDSAVSQIYQLAPGASTPTLVVGPAPSNGHSDCSVLEPSGSYWNAAIAFDAQNNLYVTDRYGSSVQFCRVPYDSTSKTWKFQTADNWVGPTYTNSSGVSSPIPPQDLQVGDDGTFYVTTSDTQSIFKFTVDSTGKVTSVTPMITGMQDMTSNIAVDHAGNLFFIENAYDAPSNRVTGIREIPANATLPIVGDGTGKAESQLLRIDPGGEGFNGIKGISFDAHGNLYFSSENNSSYGGLVDGIFMIPNEGTPTAPNLVWADTVQISPVGSGFPVLVDPRGLLWIPTGGSSNWAPPGSSAPACDSTSTKTVDATCLASSIVLWKPGTLNMGSSPVGTAGATQTLFYMFSNATTPSKIAVAQPGNSNFVFTGNPIANPTTNPPVPPCTANTTYPAFSATETTLQQYSWCAVYLQLNPTTAGSVQGELQLLDANNNAINGSNTNLSGIGQGAAASVVASAAVQPIATGLNDPRQVAADPWGNSYVADAGLKAIEYYKAGITSPIVGKAFGSNLNSPTGVAVDGAGNLYIGDSGKVIEIPYVNGALATAQQTTLPLPAGTTLGSHLNLAADTAGDVFVADKDNKQVVEIPNPQSALLLAGQPYPVLGSGFTGPTAIATDNAGDVWVADGANLWEIAMPFGQASEVITGGLQAPVTGLAVDPSGSVFVAGTNGISWIPFNTATGSLNPNGTVLVESGLGSNGSSLPYGVALDGIQDIFATYGSGSTAGMSQVGISGSIDMSSYGEINPNVPFEVDAQIFNLGNTNLAVSDDPALDLITGTDASDYSVVTATENAPACSASTNTAPGASCYLGLVLQAPSAGQTSASVSVASNAANAGGGLKIALTGNVIQDLRPATTTVVNAPSSGIVYPGNVTITVTVTSSDSSYGTPTGSITLAVGSANGNLPKQTQTLNSSGVATFTYSNLLGGTYNVSADYGGDGTAGATQNTCAGGTLCFAGSASKTTFVVNQATAAVVVGPPVTSVNGTASGGGQPPYCLGWTVSGCTPNSNFVTSWNGSTYVHLATKTYILAQVTSTVGTPTGTVSFCTSYTSGACTPADTSQGINGAIALNGNGVATFSTENLAQGIYNITAVYNGDVNYASHPIALASFEVIVPSIQVTANPATTTAKAGTPDLVTLTLMPLVGFVTSGDSLRCVPSTLPKYTECTFAYPDSSTGTISVGTNGATPSTIVVTISTNVPVNGGTTTGSLVRPSGWSLAGIFGLGMLGLIAGRKRMHRYFAAACLAAVLSGVFLGLSSCTNAGYSTPPPAPKVTTPAGTYNVQIITYHPANLQQSSLTTPVFVLPVTVQ